MRRMEVRDDKDLDVLRLILHNDLDNLYTNTRNALNNETTNNIRDVFIPQYLRSSLHFYLTAEKPRYITKENRIRKITGNLYHGFFINNDETNKDRTVLTFANKTHYAYLLERGFFSATYNKYIKPFYYIINSMFENNYEFEAVISKRINDIVLNAIKNSLV